MKVLTWVATVLMAGALALPAQQPQPNRPRAFGDKDKDGICDVTGKPVGQGRAARAAQRQQVAPGQGCCRGCRGRMARGMGRGGNHWQQPRSAPNAAQPEKPSPEQTQ